MIFANSAVHFGYIKLQHQQLECAFGESA